MKSIIKFREIFENFKAWFLEFSPKFSAVAYKWHNSQITQQNYKLDNITDLYLLFTEMP